MATKAEIIARLQAGEIGSGVERELLQALGFQPYRATADGPVLGWTDPVTGLVGLVGRYVTDLATTEKLLPPGWVYEIEQSGTQFRARVGSTTQQLRRATFTALVGSQALALCLAIAGAR